MLDLIKMDIHRLFKTTSFLVGLLLSLAISAVTILVLAGINMLVPQLAEDAVLGLSMIIPTLHWAESVSIFEILFTGLNSMSLLVVCILSAVYISEEQLSGYVKNIAGQVRDKSMVIISKFVTVALLTLCVMLAYCLGALVVGVLFFGSSLTMDMMGAFFPVLLTRYLLYLSIASIILFLCTITKSKSLAIAIGVIFGAGVTGIAYTVCETFLTFVLNTNIRIRSIVPDGLLSTISLTSTPADIARGAAVAVVYIVLFLLLSSVFMKRRDTK